MIIDMKHIFLSIIALCGGCGCVQSAELPEPFVKFHEASLLLINGLNNADEAPLVDAAEIFGEIEAADYTEFAVESNRATDVTLPTVRFDAKYCDLLRIAKFDPVKIDKLETLRATGMDTELLVINRDIAPGGNASFTFNGADQMNLLFVSTQPGALTYTVTAEGKEIPIEKTDDYSAFTSWGMGPELSAIKVSVANPTDKAVSFAIVFE